jgi:putative ABC transport system permease protein
VLAGGLGNSVATMEDAHGNNYNLTVYRLRVDHHYLDTYEMKLAAGRFFEPGNSADSSQAFVVNEALVREYGYQEPADLVGKTFEFQGVKGTIIGVVKDFHYSSLQHKVEPTCLRLLRGNFSQIAVRLQGNLPQAVKAVEAQWKKSFPNTLTDFRFAEESVNDQYLAEQRFSHIFLTFSGISLAIACLGLFALISYSIEIRVKEIGIRKVLGASVTSIVTMLTREFLQLVAVAALVAGPLAYYLMNEWLAGFNYRIELNVLVIMLAASLVLGIAWVTVSGKSVRAANGNPVQSLRSE